MRAAGGEQDAGKQNGNCHSAGHTQCPWLFNWWGEMSRSTHDVGLSAQQSTEVESPRRNLSIGYAGYSTWAKPPPSVKIYRLYRFFGRKMLLTEAVCAVWGNCQECGTALRPLRETITPHNRGANWVAGIPKDHGQRPVGSSSSFDQISPYTDLRSSVSPTSDCNSRKRANSFSIIGRDFSSVAKSFISPGSTLRLYSRIRLILGYRINL